MSPSLHKVVYKPDTQSTDEYIVFVSKDEYLKWKEGDKTIPLASVVDAFDVFHSGQGAQGHLGRPSKQILDSVFGKTKVEDCVEIVLEKGSLQAGDGLASTGNPKNDHRGGQYIDTRGSSLRG